MFTAKALVALTLTALGGATAGTVVYIQTHPPNPATLPAEPAAPMEKTAFRPPVSLAPPEPEATRSVTLEPVQITAPLPPRKVAAPARRKRAPVATAAAEPEPASVVCSDWRDLESGPAGRRVRSLCTPAPAPGNH